MNPVLISSSSDSSCSILYIIIWSREALSLESSQVLPDIIYYIFGYHKYADNLKNTKVPPINISICFVGYFGLHLTSM